MKTRRERLIALRDKVAKKLPLKGRARAWGILKRSIGWNQSAWYDRYSDHPCGTTACLAGSAGLLPEFRKAGLKTIRQNGDIQIDPSAHIPYHGNFLHACSSGAGKFFGLSSFEADSLFYGRSSCGLSADDRGTKKHRDLLVAKINELIEATP